MVCDTVLWLPLMAEVQLTQSLGASTTACMAKKKCIACQTRGTWKPVTSAPGVSPAWEMADCRPAVHALCPKDNLSPIGTKHGCGWRDRVDWSHCSLPLTSIHREHWHTNRKEWRAEIMQESRGVVGRKGGLLSIALCGLHISLRSQASVLMERLL